ncbi:MULTISPECIES: DUF5333 domain-containing protein [Pacificibacter]|uniref:DUF5333 domain-containing protein n=1 Tax=Pacificibacter TaxID=1042323 RepID=UPI001C086C84|nr:MULTISPECIES: DUF5333 domain-containing protein [Pacificibacter]MBU2935741.1 DUF5333 domain-containing protein [Pacificibacter marinus]MDO6614237.1 DUF5333 domain-containing protein [Pacificibacter sp. 1_MG-2023]
MYKFKTVILATLLTIPFAGVGAVSAKALRDEPSIDGPMLKVALAIEISDKCSSIEARKLKGLNFLWGLKTAAKKLGYSDDEIKAYVDSKAEKSRMRALGEAYVRDKGLNPTSAADLCRLGQQEIAANSLTGSLLRNR